MLSDKVILVGLNMKEINYWASQIFSGTYQKIAGVVAEHDTYGFRDQYYCLVGNWFDNPRIDNVIQSLRYRGCKELELLFEESDAV